MLQCLEKKVSCKTDYKLTDSLILSACLPIYEFQKSKEYLPQQQQ